MNYICDDNRFKIIAHYKKELMEATNIEDSPDEMAVLDNILFRFWQMGWLNDRELIEPVIDRSRNRRCPKCNTVLKGKFCHECGRRIVR